nr:hypothetical protein [Pandoravirus aubagnensis]
MHRRSLHVRHRHNSAVSFFPFFFLFFPLLVKASVEACPFFLFFLSLILLGTPACPVVCCCVRKKSEENQGTLFCLANAKKPRPHWMHANKIRVRFFLSFFLFFLVLFVPFLWAI